MLQRAAPLSGFLNFDGRAFCRHRQRILRANYNSIKPMVRAEIEGAAEEIRAQPADRAAAGAAPSGASATARCGWLLAACVRARLEGVEQKQQDRELTKCAPAVGVSVFKINSAPEHKRKGEPTDR